MIGRRGPLQAALTIAELREMTKLENCRTIWRPDDFRGVAETVPSLSRPRKRLTELMLKNLKESSGNFDSSSREFAPVFLRGPREIIGGESVEKIRLAVNELEGEDYQTQRAKERDEVEDLNCGLVLRSIGYKSMRVDESIPFDEQRGRVVNSCGKIGEDFYAAGWLATGPVGVILSTMNNAFNVGGQIARGLNATSVKSGSCEIMKILECKNIRAVSFSGWEKINRVEEERGKLVGKPREKIVNVSEMLEIAFG